MFEFAFNQDLVRYLAEHRSTGWTMFFQFFSFMGEIEGYLLVISVLLVAYDKRLALQAAVVVLCAMIANHLAKIAIQNPRPFMVDGDYAQHWAVSARNAAELAAEFSTPSGHAMAGAAFYGFLLLRIPNLPLRITLLLTILLLGISRPVIGVHFAEDIVLGWILGARIALLAHRCLAQMLRAWGSLGAPWRLCSVTALCALVWIATILALNRPLADLPTAFVAYLGFLAGLLLAIPVEGRRPNFVSQGASAQTIAIRLAVMLALMLSVLLLLEAFFSLAAAETSAIGFGLRFLRYAITGAVGALATPWIFTRLGLGPPPNARVDRAEG